jgi:L-ascorbate metabolism protein UlaG (beta-lactamase superfamily)
MHSSSMPDGSYGGQPLGFLFIFEEDDVEKVIYYEGDTALHYDMCLIQDEFEYVDFAFLPVGDNFTMGMEDAEVAAHFVNADYVIPMHYDTFGLIEIDKEELKETFEKFHLEIFEIGEQKELI